MSASTVGKYDHLKPQIHNLMTRFSDATQIFVKENPMISPNESFIVLYEAAAATLGQILGSAFAQNQNLVQAELYNQALNSIKIHAENYHKVFLQMKETENGTNTKRLY